MNIIVEQIDTEQSNVYPGKWNCSVPCLYHFSYLVLVHSDWSLATKVIQNRYKYGAYTWKLVLKAFPMATEVIQNSSECVVYTPSWLMCIRPESQ